MDLLHFPWSACSFLSLSVSSFVLALEFTNPGLVIESKVSSFCLLFLFFHPSILCSESSHGFGSTGAGTKMMTEGSREGPKLPLCLSNLEAGTLSVYIGLLGWATHQILK